MMTGMMCTIKTGNLNVAGAYKQTLTVNGVSYTNQPVAAACSSSCTSGFGGCVTATAFCCTNVDPSLAALPTDDFVSGS
jgi:hypothetical protein